VLAASGAKGWIVAPDPNPLDIRDQGNGAGSPERLGPPGVPSPGGEAGHPNGSDPTGDGETGGGT
jgi:hypothetical protein